MNRRILAVVGALFVIAVIGLFVVLRQRPEPQEVATTAGAPPSPPARPRAPVPAPSPEPRAESSRPAARPSAAAEPSPAPSPEPAAPAAPEPAPAPDEATLRIDSDVAGAQVFLDRQFVGAAPVTAEHIKPGTHQLNVSAPGFDGYVSAIDVSPGPRDVMVRFKEVRLDAKLQVIHKHRVGSCKGQLVATPQGLRYETADKDDAFMAPLTELETFQVDYLEKNLKVKLRKGKQFNFTDPDGNADRLFVFQRDVDRARERLRRGDQPAQ